MLAGAPFFDEVFFQLDCKYNHRFTFDIPGITFRVEWHLHEGQEIDPIAKVATVSGPARNILIGERIALNTLARCSGIATKYVHDETTLNPDLVEC